MANFSDGPGGVTLTGQATFPGTPQVAMTFSPKVIQFQNLGTDDVSYSFDGTNVHGTINSGYSIELSVYSNPASYLQRRIWLRDEGAGTAIVRTTAYDY